MGRGGNTILNYIDIISFINALWQQKWRLTVAHNPPQNRMVSIWRNRKPGSREEDRPTARSYLWQCHSWEVPEWLHKTGWCSCDWGHSGFLPVQKSSAKCVSCHIDDESSYAGFRVTPLLLHLQRHIGTRQAGDVDKTACGSMPQSLRLPRKATATRVTAISKTTWQPQRLKMQKVYLFSMKAPFLVAKYIFFYIISLCGQGCRKPGLLSVESQNWAKGI